MYTCVSAQVQGYNPNYRVGQQMPGPFPIGTVHPQMQQVGRNYFRVGGAGYSCSWVVLSADTVDWNCSQEVGPCSFSHTGHDVSMVLFYQSQTWLQSRFYVRCVLADYLRVFSDVQVWISVFMCCIIAHQGYQFQILLITAMLVLFSSLYFSDLYCYRSILRFQDFTVICQHVMYLSACISMFRIIQQFYSVFTYFITAVSYFLYIVDLPPALVFV